MNRIEPFSPFTFNDDQRRAASLIETFIDDTDTGILILTGHAGTGKTSMISAVIRYLFSLKRGVVLLASTGRAAKVVEEKTGVHAETVHKHIYILDENQTDDENETRRLIFKMKGNFSNMDTVYIVDESSMISDHETSGIFINFGTGRLLSDFLSFAGKHKIIFVGDPLQLPPVNSLFSPCFNVEYLESKANCRVVKAELYQNMRHGTTSTGIAFNTGAFRNIIEDGRYNRLRIRCSGFNDTAVCYSLEDMTVDYCRIIRSSGLKAGIFISFTNEAANHINHMVRNMLFVRASSPVQGDLLMVCQNNYCFDLANGEHIQVMELSDRTEIKAGLTFRDAVFRIEDNNKDRFLKAKIIEDLLYTNRPFLTEAQENSLWRDFMIRLSIRKIKQKSPDFITELLSDPYINAIRARFGYAVTCHKAQGGEWDHVYINLERILFVQPPEFQHRWAYTAVTRAVKSLHLLNNYALY